MGKSDAGNIFGTKFNPTGESSSISISNIFQWGLVGQITAQFIQMRNILHYEIPRPGVNPFVVKEVAGRVVRNGLLGAGVGVTFATAAQITKGLRGKVDEVNSFVGGAAVGALTASQRAKPMQNPGLLIIGGSIAYFTHLFYNQALREYTKRE
mmetsp:Transcript_2301/g.4250  ORF Transcript_2301/g.4250 Transcript_2301/m.4250 type:complete len:153 (+) Transcript_2301:81-539(+)|eukprot:CAMPEP_0114425906 /NCGR_PEP_ID=MMETSP0103-20121206/7490_1 /TAXON_ID=37642 ORGANISM="Paraphysomonas imperforata, Strain PA2" /NCGR_SAMPLE_ID=MMETSP0103 /ASSEMBLY_ACC=CAM_ASM_000201 /LENGTH=152 /DNA_ID=CAMNT_0001594783 /DNA_START=16 /DNA_END=474 /DNA_ORIENTATION=-